MIFAQLVQQVMEKGYHIFWELLDECREFFKHPKLSQNLAYGFYVQRWPFYLVVIVFGVFAVVVWQAAGDMQDMWRRYSGEMEDMEEICMGHVGGGGE